MLFEVDLKKIGLTDKEAAVYSAALSIGPSPVQKIARKAKVARATTYLVLDSLIAKGLTTKYVEAGKTMFVAESPHQLLRILDKKEDELQESRDQLTELIPKLQAVMKGQHLQPTVKYYEGAGGLKAMRAEIAMYSAPNDVWRNFSPIDYLYAEYGSKNFSVDYNKQRLAKGIKVKSIFTTTSEKLKKDLIENASKQKAERKFVDPKKFKSSSTMTIFLDRVAIATVEGKIGGVIIESESMATMMREMFDLLWESLD